MLEKPNIRDEVIITCLEELYDLNVTELSFLPLGADQHTAVYRSVSRDSQPYFVKLRLAGFKGITVTIPHMLSGYGMTNIISPIPTRQKTLWVQKSDFTLALYPFIEGNNGYEIEILDDHWIKLGQIIRQLHDSDLPANAGLSIPHETYSREWRELVRRFQSEIELSQFDDPIAIELATLLKSHKREISRLVEQADRLGAILKTKTTKHVVCHADLHAGNIFIDRRNTLYLIDWDTIIVAPRERDLMFAGGGLGGGWHPPEVEEALFYKGYGSFDIDPIALTYYRYERIVQDIAAYCTQILLTRGDSDDRREGLHQLTRQFLPAGVIDIAFQSEKRLPKALQSQTI